MCTYLLVVALARPGGGQLGLADVGGVTVPVPTSSDEVEAGLLGEVVAACGLGDLVLHWRQLGVSAGLVLGADIAKKREEEAE